MASSISSTRWISWEVRNPSKTCSNGTRAARLAAVAMAAKSPASCTLAANSSPQPVPRVAITSLWSPKIDRAEVARAREATWITAAVSSPAIL